MAAIGWFIILTVLCTVSSHRSSFTQLSKDWNVKCHTIVKPCIAVGSICEEGICACNPGYEINDKQTKCLKVLFGHYNEPCEEDSQCKKNFGDTGARCLKNQCVCDAGFDYINGKCKLTKGFDDSCTDDNECFAGSEYQASSCQNGRCRCNEGFYLRGKSACRRRMKKVGEECLLNEDCDFKNGTCVSRRCVNNGKPLPKEEEKQIAKEVGSTKVGDKCQSNTDCTTIGDSVCFDGRCTCDRLHFPTEDKTGCIPEIGAKCDLNEEELHVDHAVCRENLWTCKITKVPSKDNRECIELADKINGTCNDNRECRLFVHGQCKGDRCGCEENSYYNEEEHFCSNKHDSKVLGSYCVTEKHCEDSTNSYCQDNKCKCKDNYFENNNQCARGVNATCQNNNDCTNYEHGACNETSKTCQCETNYVGIFTTECWPQSKYHEECKYTEQCLAVSSGSVCKNSRCECENTHYYKEGKCHPKKYVGEECSSSDDCVTALTSCRDDVCKCIFGYKSVEDKCVLSLGSDCRNSTDCQIASSSCQDNLCLCNKNYFEEDGKCHKGLNSPCEKTTECRTEHSTCDKSDSTCKCRKSFVPNPDDKCVPISKYHGECEIDEQCSTAVPNSFCNVTEEANVCECIEGYYFKNKECYPMKLVNENCTQTNDCFTPNTDCVNKLCICKEKFHLKDDTCYANRTVTEECTVSEECTTTNSHCDKGKCACVTPQYPNYHKDKNTCSSAAINGPLFSIFVFVLLGLKVLF